MMPETEPVGLQEPAEKSQFEVRSASSFVCDIYIFTWCSCARRSLILLFFPGTMWRDSLF